MIKKLLKFKNTFEKFKKFLILNKYAKNFNRLVEAEKIVCLVLFLEGEGVNFVEALNYYNYNYPSASFTDKLENTIIKEFYRMENNIECNYIPF